MSYTDIPLRSARFQYSDPSRSSFSRPIARQEQGRPRVRFSEDSLVQYAPPPQTSGRSAPQGSPLHAPLSSAPRRASMPTVRPSDAPLVSSPSEYGSQEGHQNPYDGVHSGYPFSQRRDNTPEMTRPQKRVRISLPPDHRSDSNDSEETLHGSGSGEKEGDDDMSRFSLSSYRHPYDILPPSSAYTGRPAAHASVSQPRQPPVRRRQSVGASEKKSIPSHTERRRMLYGNIDPREDGHHFVDPDDPDMTGIRKVRADDIHHDEKEKLRLMSYKQRRKYLSRATIEFNVTTIANRQQFIVTLAQSLVTFGAPSHRIESQLLSAGKILDIECEFVHLPTVIICVFNGADQQQETTETHFVNRKGSLNLGALHRVHQVYRSVVHDEISAKEAIKRLHTLLEAEPIYGPFSRAAFSFFLAAVICPLAFGGSFLDMWIAAVGALGLFCVQSTLSSKAGTIYANVYDITVTIAISFLARGLSSIKSEIFCYTAISSAGIVGILPGFLILCSSLELGSKNIVCGSVNMVYALIYTLFLGFGLQIGSDLFLLFDQSARTELTTLAVESASAVSITGTFVADAGVSNTLTGSFTYTNSTPVILEHIIEGCYRPPNLPWFVQPFPAWSQFVLVPAFAILLALSNLQPWLTLDFVVMTIISCVSYVANKVANHFIFGHSDIVSSIGAFAVGMLGNLYSRQMGGTAFTVMVPGVLFLVPSGLSQAGGITAQGDGIAIGYAMISVTVGITVGLFLSQALVYMFGTRKNAAIFSF